MSPERKGLDRRGTSRGELGEEATTGILSTAISAVCFLAAFTFCHGAEQLLLVIVGGILIAVQNKR